MASFSGTQAKCKACGKTAYPMEQLVAEGVIFHKGCFRCSHCKNTLKLNNYVSLEGVFYCKPHFEQLFQATGSFAKSFDDAIKTEKENPPPPESMIGDGTPSRSAADKRAPNPLASKFAGTQEKCAVCAQTVYLLEKVTVENLPYHKGCFKCSYGGCTLSTTNSKTHNAKLYCAHHFHQLVLKKGNFSTLQDGETGVVPATSTEQHVELSLPTPEKKEETAPPSTAKKPAAAPEEVGSGAAESASQRAQNAADDDDDEEDGYE